MESSQAESAATDRDVVDVGHTRVSYTKTGTGPALLFVHGWPLNGHTWRNVASQLDGFTRYVIDLPGAGHSPLTPQTPFHLHGLIDTVVSVIDTLGLDDVTLVGQDSGAMICRFVAEKRPHAVSALVLSGTEIPGVHPPLVTMFKMLAKLPGARAMFRLSMGNKMFARSPLVLGGAMHDKSLLNGEFRTEMLDPVLADDAAIDAAVRLIKDWSNDDVDALAETHRNLTMPTLLVWGEGDPFFPVGKARAMVDQFGGPVEFETLADCKLLVHEEHPARLAGLIRDFVGRHRNFD